MNKIMVASQNGIHANQRPQRLVLPINPNDVSDNQMDDRDRRKNEGRIPHASFIYIMNDCSNYSENRVMNAISLVRFTLERRETIGEETPTSTSRSSSILFSTQSLYYPGQLCFSMLRYSLTASQPSSLMLSRMPQFPISESTNRERDGAIASSANQFLYHLLQLFRLVEILTG